jgi:uncharacterized protein YozE (UPF0346 family)
MANNYEKAKVDSFANYCIKKYISDDSILGDLAKDIESDSGFPKMSNNKDEILRYLRLKSSCYECIEAFEEAWGNYKSI